MQKKKKTKKKKKKTKNNYTGLQDNFFLCILTAFMEKIKSKYFNLVKTCVTDTH